MKSTKLKLKRETAISAVRQVIQEHAEEINAYLREESRYWLDLNPKVDVADGDKTLDENIVPTRPGFGYFGWLEEALEEWLLDEGISERQYQLVAGDEDARKEILWDLLFSFAARTKYQDLPASGEFGLKTQNP